MQNICHALILPCWIYFRKHKNIFAFSVISKNWNSAGSWNLILWKKMTHLFHKAKRVNYTLFVWRQCHGCWCSGNKRIQGIKSCDTDLSLPAGLTHLSLMHRWTGSALFQIMACRLDGAKPLSEPMLTYCQWDPKEHISRKFYLKFKCFHSRKCIWICRLRNGSHLSRGRWLTSKPWVESGDVWVQTQHCDHWCPGAKAPGYQYPQCWWNIHWIGPVLYQNNTYWTSGDSVHENHQTR